ncbi:MAG TPA: hypothetical protein PKC43_00715 [Phycisphaerales bacterium]|nr:hypothetical protein [Phycisphaerales bacterium]HMP35947.1 hypothetical protein [Phycisphaerales bacterium]
MKHLLVAAAILAMLCTTMVTLMAIVFCLGMGANAKPPEIRALKLWMLGLFLLGSAGVGIGVFLVRAGHPGWAAGVSAAPSVIMVTILGVALMR